MKVTCKCHGVSGSCSLITCWQQLAPFRKVGDHLQDKYGDATRVKTTRSGRLRVRRKASNIPIPTANDLVFLHRSPNYCHHNDTIGSLGEFSLLINKPANMITSGSDFPRSLDIGGKWVLFRMTNIRYYGNLLITVIAMTLSDPDLCLNFPL